MLCDCGTSNVVICRLCCVTKVLRMVALVVVWRTSKSVIGFLCYVSEVLLIVSLVVYIVCRFLLMVSLIVYIVLLRHF